MTTFSSRTSTSMTQSVPSRSMKLSERRHLKAASHSTATAAPSEHSSSASAQTSSSSSNRVTRHRWLIQQRDTGDFLGTILDGKPTWVQHPLDALTHQTMEAASNNLHKLRDFYKVNDIRLEPINFYSYPERPTQWFTDYD